MGVWLYNDRRIKYYPAPLERWPRMPWNISQIVANMTQLAQQYKL
jgi:hypothetical protein